MKRWILVDLAEEIALVLIVTCSIWIDSPRCHIQMLQLTRLDQFPPISGKLALVAISRRCSDKVCSIGGIQFATLSPVYF